MSNSNWVCFECHEARRQKSLCPQCGTEMVCIGMKIEIPAKRDETAWVAMRREIGERGRNLEETEFANSVRRKHDLEQEIEKLKALPTNQGRSRLIRQLQKTLNEI